MKNAIVALFVASFGIGVGATPALAAEDLQARSWAASCAACHGTEGRAVGGMPALAGKPKQELYSALKAFKGGAKPATVMHQHAKGYTDEQLERIAEYFAKQKP